jgi:hypothetical protein
VQDDNSVVTLHPKTMEVLELFRGDTVLLKVRLHARSVTGWVRPAAVVSGMLKRAYHMMP